MRPQDAAQRIVELAPDLNVALTLAKFREYQKGGLPGQSMSDGRGGDSPCPVAVTPENPEWLPERGMSKGRVLGVSDPTDRQLRSDRLLYESNLRMAALALETCMRIQLAWTEPLLTDTKKAETLDEAKGGVPCANVACDRWMTGTQDNRPRHINGAALCERCYRYERRTKKRWTPALEAAEAS